MKIANIQRRLSYLLCVFSVPLAAQTNISIGSAALQTGVKRLGINLGGQTFYDSDQLTKNLTNINVGYQPTMYQSMIPCATGSNATICVVSGGTWGGNASFWPTGTPIKVISGAAAGCSTTASWNGSAFAFSTPCPAALANGDYLIVGPQLFGGTAQLLANQGWSSTTGNATITAQSSDVPPSPSQSTQTAVLTGTGPGSVATLRFGFDTTAGHSFVRLNGTYEISFWAKGISGTGQAVVEFDRAGQSYLSPTSVTLTSSWAQYSLTFVANETSFPCSAGVVCATQATVSTTGADVFYIDNFQTKQCSTLQTGGCVADAANPTVFRDEVVSTLQSLKPGVIRMWDGTSLTMTLDSLLADQTGRYPSNFNSYQTTYNHNSSGYSIPEFLQLVQVVGNGAEAWIVVPITFSPGDASNLIDYLSGGSETIYGAKRIAQGFIAPWTSVIPKIHLEFGNEAWNSGFSGGVILNDVVYGQRADLIFAAMKAKASYVGSRMDLVLGGFAINANYSQISQSYCTHNDSLDFAPYIMGQPTDATSPNQWNSTLVEPQAYFYGSGTTNNGVTAEGLGSQYLIGPNGTTIYYGGMSYLMGLAAAHASKQLSIYEENMGTISGTYNQTQLNSYVSAWGAGLATIEEELLGIQYGILTQNVFSLGQYEFARSDHSNVYMWGTVIDMGGSTNLNRPQFLAMQVANSAISPGATMLKTTQTKTPTLNLSLTNTVQMNNANLVQSFAFNNGSGHFGLVLLNIDTAGSHAVTFSGVNAPQNGSTVIQTVLTSNNLSDTNESSNVIAPVTTTLTSFNPSAGITLPPYSEVVLTWGGSGSPSVLLTPRSLTFPSTTAGSPSPPQTVLITNPGTAPLTISNIFVAGGNETDFIQTNTCSSSLSVSSSCKIVVTFTPTTSGTRSASILIWDNAQGSPHSVTLIGTATDNLHSSNIFSSSEDHS